ncbi:hypothetical protein N7468_007442 [Penicillium chermesinum]|uniref:Uncharacterized protein n=1 Tax=Penicillium chermesinum TaxID=63820 RepID=A0A9W9TKI2_9EURO|nr:uncharacterized protein N7468_007442 [Penicillium chermesinum]KAJ5226217.1 hypothetical protein N7468_007442 [Penicillium chermesinum]
MSSKSPRKTRGPISALRSYFSKYRFHYNPSSCTDGTDRSTTAASNRTDDRGQRPTGKTAGRSDYSNPESTPGHPAGLALTTYRSAAPTPHSRGQSCSSLLAIARPDRPSGKDNPASDEDFRYLRSLITISASPTPAEATSPHLPASPRLTAQKSLFETGFAARCGAEVEGFTAPVRAVYHPSANFCEETGCRAA